MKTTLITIGVCLALALASVGQTSSTNQSGSTMTTPSAAPNQQNRGQLSPSGVDRIIKEVHHELVLQPYYSVFDNLAYKVTPDGTVTLMGQVVDPTLKSSAESAVKHIEGVTRVDNQIEVLPTSPNDDQIRRATYRAIYGNDVLRPYSLRAVPPIHIIVKNGHVTLDGVVARAMDKQIADTQAKSVPGVFSVEDNIQVENSH